MITTTNTKPAAKYNLSNTSAVNPILASLSAKGWTGTHEVKVVAHGKIVQLELWVYA